MREALGELPFVAEDLGEQMENVYALRDKVNLPGMKLMQYGFGDPTSVDIPHNFSPNCIVYIGTHDNNTCIGWYKNETTPLVRKRISEYLGKKVNKKNIHLIMSEAAYASVADTVILSMQDLLGLDGDTRLNTPGTNSDNWLWQMTNKQLSEFPVEQLRKWIELYNRK